MYNDKYTFMTNVDNCDTTYTKHKHNMREVWARLHAVRCLVFITHVSHPHWFKSSRESVISSSRHVHVRLSLILFDVSLYLSPHFLAFFLSFLSLYSKDFDSVTNILHNSADGSFITSDDLFPLTDSVIVSGGDFQELWADQQRLQISDLHFDKFLTLATFACWKMKYKTEVCTCSQIPTEAMQWIKEVELVDSVDKLKSSSSTRGISMPNFEVLDARIASALNKIIQNSQFKRRISLEEQKAQKEDRFLRGGQIECILDLRLLLGHWDPWFCRKLNRPDHYCSSKWR